MDPTRSNTNGTTPRRGPLSRLAPEMLGGHPDGYEPEDLDEDLGEELPGNSDEDLAEDPAGDLAAASDADLIHGAQAASMNRNRTVVIHAGRRGRKEARKRGRNHGRGEGPAPGSRLVSIAAALLTILDVGLLGVSISAQYHYVLAERHRQVTASLVEAAALDLGMIIFTLLAVGLARRGLSAKVERAFVVICAAGSALMNYAAADVSSPRSVLAYCMPPIFLAAVTDRVVVTIRRHVLGMHDRSPWAVFGHVVTGTLRVIAMILLYLLRFLLDPPSTSVGVRRAVLQATPLPGKPEPAGPALTGPVSLCTHCMRAIRRDVFGAWWPVDGLNLGQTGPSGEVITVCKHEPVGRRQELDRPDKGSGGGRSRGRRKGRRGSGGETKTAKLLRLAAERHDGLHKIPLGRTSTIANSIAEEIGLHPATARKELAAAVASAHGNRPEPDPAGPPALSPVLAPSIAPADSGEPENDMVGGAA